ncbi:unnamed protein product [Blepharisma stoltei]|uniref:Cyclic nucleotide-binding domain-containing protein n=1 Tax=Blepharisma stoltei TaxID=1481888 RepID=A0AAU9IGU0_9CILI|nr:unnamed protein product [Blepharisma stoltei]
MIPHSYSEIPDSIQAILSIPPNKRSLSDIGSLMKATSHIKFFQDLIEREKSSKIHQSLCKVLSINEYKSGKNVFKVGDVANAVFFILKGQVRVLVPGDAEYQYDIKTDLKEGPNLDEQSPVEFHSTRTRAKTICLPPSQLLRNYVQMKIFNKDIVAENKKPTFIFPIKQPGYKEIATIGPGASFGELALHSEKPRNATFECLRPTVLAVLSKEDYQSAASLHEKATSEKIEFLQSLPEFSAWTRLALFKLCYCFSTLTLKRGNVLFNEGDPIDQIYIIKEGELKYTKKFCVEVPNSSYIDTLGQPYNKIKKMRSPQTRRMKTLQIVIKQKGDMFGYEEIWNKKNSRQFTCACVSNSAEIFAISEKEFLKRIMHPESIKVLDEHNKILNNWIEKRTENLQDMENYKDNIAFTPAHKLKQPSNTVDMMTQRQSKPNYYSVESTPKQAKNLPKILMSQSTSTSTKSPKSSSLSRPRIRDLEDKPEFSYFSMFNTELTEDSSVSPYKHNGNTKRFNEVSMTSRTEKNLNMSFSPTKLSSSRHRRTNKLNRSFIL